MKILITLVGQKREHPEGSRGPKEKKARREPRESKEPRDLREGRTLPQRVSLTDIYIYI